MVELHLFIVEPEGIRRRLIIASVESSLGVVVVGSSASLTSEDVAIAGQPDIFLVNASLVKESRENIRKAGVEKLAEIRQQDILTVDFSPAQVVTMYLLPDVNLRLKPNLLKQLKPGSRVVSHSFDMGDWKPDRVERVDGRTIYLWTIPAKKK